MKRGSAKEDIQRDILCIKELESNLDIHLSVIWAQQETRTISWEEAGSKMHKSTDEWSIAESHTSRSADPSESNLQLRDLLQE